MLCFSMQNETLTAEIVTKTREELIYLSAFLARGLTQHINIAKPPSIISIDGHPEAGKSLIVESMIKSMLDSTNFEDMLVKGEQEFMFLEKYKMHAADSNLQKTGTINGQKSTLVFDRVCMQFNAQRPKILRNRFNDYAPEGYQSGVIFETDNFDQAYKYNLLDISVQYNSERNRDGSGKVVKAWDRAIKIAINQDSLKSSPAFLQHWQQIKKYKQTGRLKETKGTAPTAAKSWLNILCTGKPQRPINYTAPHMQIA